MDLNTVLRNAQSGSDEVRAAAESQLTVALEQQYAGFMMALCGELATEGTPDGNRQLAGLYLKNLITAHDVNILEGKTRKWFECDEATKSQLRAGFLQALLSPVRVVSHTAAQVVAAYGAVDVQIGAWPTLMASLLNNIGNAEVSLISKVSTMETLGFMCDNMDSDKVSKEFVNQLLTTIVSGMGSTQPDELRRAAVCAMLNSLEFTEHNFNVAEERNAIMQAVCDATQCPDAGVRVKAFECIATIAALYYEKLNDYSTALYQITSTAIKTGEPLVAQNAIEFWVTVAEEEFDISEEEVGDDEAPLVMLNLTAGAAPTLVPILLEALTKQEDENAESDEEWGVSLAAASCLQKMAVLLGDTMVDMVVAFVSQYVTSAEWRLREASIMAFACILDGPSDARIAPLVVSGLPALVNSLADQTPLVRDTTAWALSRIFEFHSTVVSREALNAVVSGLLTTLDDRNAKIAEQSALAFLRLGNACEDGAEDESNILSDYFDAILLKLFATSVRPDSDDGNLRTTTYEAIEALIRNSAIDKQGMTVQAMGEVLNRLEMTFQVSADQQDRMTLQSLLCGTLGVCIQKLPVAMITPSGDRIMAVILQVLNVKGAVAHEDAFIVCGYFADRMGEGFERYMPHFQAALLAGLQSVQEHAVVIMAAGVLGDLSRALGKRLTPYCETIMSALVQLLQSEALHRCVVCGICVPCCAVVTLTLFQYLTPVVA
jgi:importin subunit beta-1